MKALRAQRSRWPWACSAPAAPRATTAMPPAPPRTARQPRPPPPCRSTTSRSASGTTAPATRPSSPEDRPDDRRSSRRCSRSRTRRSPSRPRPRRSTSRGGANGVVHRGAHLRRRRPTPTRRSAACASVDDAGRRGHGQRPGHRRPGRRVGGDGRGRHPAGRLATSSSEDWGDQNAYPARRVRHRRHVPAARRRWSRQGVTEIGLIRVDLAAASALLGLIGGPVRRRGRDVRLRRPRPGRHHRLQPVHPGGRGRGRGRRLAGARRAGGRPGRPGRRAARHRPADRLQPRHLLATARRRAWATSPIRWCSCGRLPAGHLRPARCTRRCARTWRRRRGVAPAGQPQGQSACARGSASTRCST